MKTDFILFGLFISPYKNDLIAHVFFKFSLISVDMCNGINLEEFLDSDRENTLGYGLSFLAGSSVQEKKKKHLYV